MNELNEQVKNEKLNLIKEKEMWEKIFKEQNDRLDKEIELIQNIKKIKLSDNIESNELEKKKNLKCEYEQKDIKSEIENMKSLYNIKLSQLEIRKKNLEQEKNEFEK